MTPPSNRQTSPYDELAELFLTDPDVGDEPPMEAGSTAPARVRLALVGHLPVRAGLWITPYADAAAQYAGPTAMVRLDGPAPSIELLRCDTELAERARQPTLEASIDAVAGSVSQWIIRPDVRAGVDQIDTRGFDDVHVLTSADEAAVVAAYQMVKSVVETAQQDHRRAPTFALAVLGAQRDAADRMADRLNRTCRSFLGVEAPLSICVPRMEHTIQSSVYCRFETDGDAPTLDEIMDRIHRAEMAKLARPVHDAAMEDHRAADDESAPADDAPFSTRRDEPARTPRDEFIAALEAELADDMRGEVDEPELNEAPSPAAQQPSVAAGHARRGSETSCEESRAASDAEPPPFDAIPGTRTRRVRLAPKAGSTVECKTPGRPTEPETEGHPKTLAEQIGGLAALPVRCPGHERIELAADDRGRIHLLLRDPDLRDVHVVTRWVRTHHELLTLACREFELNVDQPPAVHLFTDRPDGVADLHGSDLHLHVVAPVDVDGRRGWYAAPLNRPRAAYG